jgi:hypothetical protein
MVWRWSVSSQGGVTARLRVKAPDATLTLLADQFSPTGMQVSRFPSLLLARLQAMDDYNKDFGIRWYIHTWGSSADPGPAVVRRSVTCDPTTSCVHLLDITNLYGMFGLAYWMRADLLIP